MVSSYFSPSPRQLLHLVRELPTGAPCVVSVALATKERLANSLSRWGRPQDRTASSSPSSPSSP
ncbi:hypothetical protein JYQ62_28775 [Nostoc sp. UHCC 0702]|nr:hypothetical protein JYQ62_28775 [Nostoc sp. UHCC 0702]